MSKYISLVLSLVSISLVSGCQQSPAFRAKSPVIPESLQGQYDQFKFAPAMRAGNMLYLSGVVAKLNTSDKGDISLAIGRAFDEIEMILKEADATWADVVDVTSYMTNLEEQIGPLWIVKEARVPAPYPAWTAIGIESLFGGQNAIIEIKVVAYLPD